MSDDGPSVGDTMMKKAFRHSAVKPYVDLDVYSVIYTAEFGDNGPDRFNVLQPRLTWHNYYKKGGFSYLGSDSDGKKTAFLIRPVYDFQGGKELKGDRTMFTAAGGIIIDADYKQKLGLELRLVSGFTALNNAQDSVARYVGIIPGWGDRALGNNGTYYQFNHLSGNLIWRPSKVFNLQAGRDKHFWGEGYRSLFLSDVSAAFPYIKQQTTIWRFQYTSLFAAMKSLRSWNDTNTYDQKFATFHYLSFNAAKWLNLAVFEAVIWQGKDANRHRGFDPNYLNPLVFFRPVEYSLGSSDNAMLGFAFKIRFNENNHVYSQLILDEFFLKEIKNWKQGWWANKQGVQIGYKCYNFGQVQHLFMQAEVNVVRPFTYSHGSPQQNYSNAGMPLAHPLGANFFELFGLLQYQWRGLTVAGKLVGARYGLDTAATNYGQDIFKSYMTRTSISGPPVDYNHHLFDGVGTNIFYAEFKASYRFGTAFPLRVELTAGARAENNSLQKKKSSYVVAGLCLPLWRACRDY